MPVREFTDSRGVEWRVWDVTPAHMHPVTRGEDYLADLQEGWLAFEAGREKRRLEAPYPDDWTTAPIPVLEELCRRASVVIRRRPRTASAQRQAANAVAIEHEAIREADDVRAFNSPRGREWLVRLHECLDEAGATQTVLRFTSGDVVLELADWPASWRELNAHDYALLLLDAIPPRRHARTRGPQRRADDRPA